MNGEIQVLADNNAADTDHSQASDSVAWMAILEDGTLVAPGTVGTLKLDYVTLPSGGGAAAFRVNTELVNQQAAESDGYGLISFNELTAAAGVSIPERLKALALFPADEGDYGVDNFYMRNIGERVEIAGGRWNNGTSAGVFYLSSYYLRTFTSQALGFRCAYVDIPT